VDLLRRPCTNIQSKLADKAKKPGLLARQFSEGDAYVRMASRLSASATSYSPDIWATARSVNLAASASATPRFPEAMP